MQTFGGSARIWHGTNQGRLPGEFAERGEEECSPQMSPEEITAEYTISIF